TIGLMGLVASFHGIILASGRASYEFSRAGYMPAAISKIHSTFKTPANALLLNMGLGIAALLTGKTAEIISISVFGALTIYFISMISILVLRKKEPVLERPFKVPLYPLLPLIALIISAVFLVAMVTLNLQLALIFFLVLALAFVAYLIFTKKQ
ncbi:MAG: amino acid permease, partial [Bacteroidota bacterium]|nr:amino acid permease [Bacteroidota bacterium]